MHYVDQNVKNELIDVLTSCDVVNTTCCKCTAAMPVLLVLMYMAD